MAIEPITRKEKYLAAIVGQAVELPEPITREEMFLAEIANNGTGGGGDSGSTNAVLYTPQTLTAEQQKQARDNVGAWPIIDVVELPTENIREDCYYRLTLAFYCFSIKNVGAQELDGFVVHVVDTLPEKPNNRYAGTTYLYYARDTDSASVWVNEKSAAVAGIPVGWYGLEEIATIMGETYGGVVHSAFDTEDKSILVVKELYYYNWGWKRVSDGVCPDKRVSIAYSIATDISDEIVIQTSDKTCALIKKSDVVLSAKDIVESHCGYYVGEDYNFATIESADVYDSAMGALVVSRENEELFYIVYDKDLLNSTGPEELRGKLENGIYVIRTTLADGTVIYPIFFKNPDWVRTALEHTQPEQHLFLKNRDGTLCRIWVGPDGSVVVNKV